MVSRRVHLNPAPRVSIREWRGRVALQVGCGTVDLTLPQALAIAQGLREACAVLAVPAPADPAREPEVAS